MKRAAKAFVALLVAGLGTLATALADERLSTAEAALCAATALGAWQAVYWTRNARTRD